MKHQPRVVVNSVLLALLIHILIAYALIWKTEDAPLTVAALTHSTEVTLDNHAYQQILQQQKKTIKQQHINKQNEKKNLSEVKKRNVVKPNNKRLKKPKPVQAKLMQQKVTQEVEPLPIKKAMSYTSKEVSEKINDEGEEVLQPVAPTLQSDVATKAVAEVQEKKTVTPSQRKSSASTGESTTEKPIEMNSMTKRYIAQLMRHLNRYKQYPISLKKNHIEGKPVIRFSINKSGQITLVEVKRHAKHAELDRAAMEVFRRASPLPKIPSEMERDTLTMSLPIAYSLIND